MTDEAMLARFETLAIAAGAAIMEVFEKGATVEHKADDSPVTEADRRAEEIILSGLRAAWPDIPCVAEEEISSGKVPEALGDAFFLVDPLDGTREFIAGRPDFTVNIALVRDGRPEVGVVFAPARGTLYSGRTGQACRACVSAGGEVAERTGIHVAAAASPIRVVASRSHRTPETDAFIARHDNADIVSVGSSLKFCLLAEGEADLYPRFGRTMEWDTAAGDAVLRAAGGRTRLVDGGAFVYGKRNQPGESDFANPWFIADSGN